MNKELVDYVKQQTAAGAAKNKIADILSRQGWHKTEIDEAFAQAQAGGADFSGVDLSEDGQGGSNRKIILWVAGGLAALAAAIGIIVLVSGPKNEELPIAQEQTLPADQNAAAQNNANAQAEQTDPVVLAAINGLAGSITAPSGWQVKKGTISLRPLAVYFKPTLEKDSAGKDIFQENISVTQDSLSQVEAADSAAYMAKAKAGLVEEISDYKILTERKVKLADGSEATLTDASFTQNGVPLRNRQLLAFKGDNVYVVTGVTVAANWEKEKDMMGAAVMSFKFPGAN